MQPIKILCTDFIPRAEIEAYSSLTFTRSWHGIGTFELHINRYAHGVDEIKKNRLIVLSPNKVGIVKHREIRLDQNGKESETWIFKGYTLKGIASQRITVPPSHTAYDNISGDVETVMRHYASNNIISPSDEARKVEWLVHNTNQNRGLSISRQSRFNNLAEELQEISLSSGIGWDILLNFTEKKWEFDVFEGRDLSYGNTAGNSPVFFSPEFENIKAQSFVDSDLNTKNAAFVGGQGEGIDRDIVELGDASGIERIETFIDARDVVDTTLLTERGQQKLDELSNEMFLEAEILTPITRTTYEYQHEGFVSPYQPTGSMTNSTELYSPFIYGSDFDLGDIVTVMNKGWDVMAHQRITEVKEIHEPGGFKLEAVFGQKRPTLISKVKQELAQYDNELKR